jgi:hypothetical protein
MPYKYIRLLSLVRYNFIDFPGFLTVHSSRSKDFSVSELRGILVLNLHYLDVRLCTTNRHISSQNLLEKVMVSTKGLGSKGKFDRGMWDHYYANHNDRCAFNLWATFITVPYMKVAHRLKAHLSL